MAYCWDVPSMSFQNASGKYLWNIASLFCSCALDFFLFPLSLFHLEWARYVPATQNQHTTQRYRDDIISTHEADVFPRAQTYLFHHLLHSFNVIGRVVIYVLIFVLLRVWVLIKMNEIKVSGGDSASADREIVEEIRDAENQQMSEQSNEESDEHADYESAVDAVSKLPGRKKKENRRGWRSPSEEETIDDLVDIIVNNNKLIFENSKKTAKKQLYDDIHKNLSKRLGDRSAECPSTKFERSLIIWKRRNTRSWIDVILCTRWWNIFKRKRREIYFDWNPYQRGCWPEIASDDHFDPHTTSLSKTQRHTHIQTHTGTNWQTHSETARQ